MESGPSKVFVKKSSKKPQPLVFQETEHENEQLMPNIQETNQRKVDIFQLPKIFQSNPKEPLKPNPIRQSNQHHKKSVMSRQAMKRMIESRKKRGKYANVQKRDLSLIRQTQSQESLTQSQSDSILNQSSISEVASQDFSQDLSEKKMNTAFIEEGEIDVLNKTVVMSKKKVHVGFQTPKTQHQDIQRQTQLIKLSHKFSLEKFNEFYLQGKLQQKDYLKILQIKKQESMRQRDQRFNWNLQKIQKAAQIIHGNYRLLYQKLKNSVDIAKKEMVDVTQTMVEMHRTKKENEFNPQSSRLQLQMLQKLAEIKAMQTFLQILRNSLEEFQTNYNQQLQKLQVQRNSKQNFSQNVIFKQIKESLKLGQQVYQYFVSSLRKDRKTGKSLIAQNARKHYLKFLEEKESVQLEKIQQFINEDAAQSAVALIGNEQSLQQVEAIYQQLMHQAQKKVHYTLKALRELFTKEIAWINTVHLKGQLKLGNIFKEALLFLTQNQPTNLSIQEHKQKFLINSFKFYRRQVFRRFEAKVDTVQRLYLFFSTKDQVKHMQRQERKKQRVLNGLGKLQKKDLVVSAFINEKSFIQNPKHDVSSAIQLSSAKNESIVDKFTVLLKTKMMNFNKLQQRVSVLLQDDNEPTVRKKRQLIPQKSVCRYDFRKKQAQLKKQTTQKSRRKSFSMSPWNKNLISKQISDKNEIILSQIQTERQNLQNYIKNDALEKDYDSSKQRFRQQMLRNAMDADEKKYTTLQKERHFDKVYQLILNRQVEKKVHLEETQQPYRPKSIWEGKWKLFSSMKLSSYKPYEDVDFIFSQTIASNTYPELQFSSNTSYLQPSTKSSSQSHPLTLQQIQSVCQQFSKDFYVNPTIRNKLKLDEKQFQFLMSPQYRKFFLEQKIKDQQLTDKILQLARKNTVPLSYGQQPLMGYIYNPVNYMMHVDPYFQQKIEEYQRKIVKNQQVIAPQQNLFQKASFYDTVMRDSSYSDLNFVSERMEYFEEQRALSYWQKKDQQCVTRDQQSQFYQDWLID